MLILRRNCGIKVVGNKDIKDIRVTYKNSNIFRFNYYAFARFDIENSTDTWVYIFPYYKGALVDAMTEYDIMNINGIEVKYVKEYEKNLYHWDKGEHSYYMVAESILEEDLYKIINGLSIEISDESVVKECLKIRGT